MSDDDKITQLPVGFKKPPQEDGRTLKVVDHWTERDKCNHRSLYRSGRFVSVTYLIRDGETEVECGNCGTKLEPMWVLSRLAHEETDFDRKRQIAADEMKRLQDRTRTKCDHCGQMTRISRAKARA